MAEKLIPLDSDWLRANPLPVPDEQADKNERGRVVIIGGSSFVPGAVQLSALAALRAGAGKVQVATVQTAALSIGFALPEVAVIALPEADGEIAGDAGVAGCIERCDAVLIGPAMGGDAAGAVLDSMLARPLPPALVLDAGCLMTLPDRATAIAAQDGQTVLTPHIGEIAALLGIEAAAIERDRPASAKRAAKKFNAVVVLKGPTTFVAAPDGAIHAYPGGGVGLATSGSGDVLAGIATGLAARGAAPLLAALWAVWLHGEAGRRCAEQIGPVGYLARELLDPIPRLLHAV